MIKLKIMNIDNYIYTLTDEKGKKYSLNLDFIDLKNNPTIGDYIMFAEDLLNPKYDGASTTYTFGKLDSMYGRDIQSTQDVDVIKVITKDLEIYLKRLYG